MKLELINSTPETEVVTTRTMDAPRELVFKAWTDPEHLKNWWGPNGFTNTFNEFDLKPGGYWRFIMHSPNNDNYPNECVLIKIDNPKFVAWNHISNPQFQIVTTFDELPDNKTKLTFKMVFNTAKECSNLRAFVTVKNEENFDRLEVELKRMI